MGKRMRIGCQVALWSFMASVCFAQGSASNTPDNQVVSPANMTSAAFDPGGVLANTRNIQEYAGEFFGMPVPLANYYFVRYAVAIFGNRQGAQPKTPQEVESVVWDQLLLSYEAFRRNIQVSSDEVEKEISKIMEAEKVSFDWKKEKAAYEQWVKQKTNQPAVALENQIRHLLQIEKLKQRVADDSNPQVSEAEARQEFLNEYNTLGVELRQFDDKKAAQDFYKKAKIDSGFWEAQKKADEKEFKRPGFVSLEFLMDLWKFPKDALYKMMKERVGQVHRPEPIYSGFGVFKILEKRVANEKEFAKVRDSYYNKIRKRKQREGMDAWFAQLKQQAAIKVYPRAEKTGVETAQGSAVNTSVRAESLSVPQEKSKGGVK